MKNLRIKLLPIIILCSLFANPLKAEMEQESHNNNNMLLNLSPQQARGASNLLTSLGISFKAECTNTTSDAGNNIWFIGDILFNRYCTSYDVALVNLPPKIKILQSVVTISRNGSGTSTYSGAAQQRAQGASSALYKLNEIYQTIPSFDIIYIGDNNTEAVNSLPSKWGFVEEVRIRFNHL